jgi:hypothetical protein
MDNHLEQLDPDLPLSAFHFNNLLSLRRLTHDPAALELMRRCEVRMGVEPMVGFPPNKGIAWRARVNAVQQDIDDGVSYFTNTSMWISLTYRNATSRPSLHLTR